MKRLFLTVTLCFLTILAYSQTLFIYGGFNHEVFLGTLNESPQSKRSIWNEYGQFGHDFSKLSIWNDMGDYGDEASIYSPWNKYSDDVPILVDALGHNYGEFNSSNQNAVVRKICELAPSIMSGELMLSEAYRKIFKE